MPQVVRPNRIQLSHAFGNRSPMISVQMGSLAATKLGRRKRRIAFFLLCISFISTTLTALVVWTSRNLRPIADDYSLGVNAVGGLFHSLVLWWQTWSGDLTGMFFNIVFVGVPLQVLPWTMASAVPFLFSVILVSAFVLWLLSRDMKLQGSTFSKFHFLIALPVVMVMWWAFWWIGTVTTDTDQNVNLLPRGLTFWQNLNAGYVITMVALIWLWLALERARSKFFPTFLFGLYLALGFFTGMAGPVFAISSLLFIFILIAAMWISNNAFLQRQVGRWGVAVLGLLTGFFVARFSPGNQIRSELLMSPDFNADLGIQIVMAIPQGFMDWWDSIAEIGTISTALFVASISYAIGLMKVTLNTGYLARYGLAFIVFALVLAVMNRISELFAYPAWWHLIPIKMTVWLSVICFAAAIGMLAAQHVPKGRSFLLLTSLFISSTLMVLIGASILQMTVEVNSRVSTWNMGPAPLPGIGDIEDPDGWISIAWRSLNEQRNEKALGTPIRRE